MDDPDEGTDVYNHKPESTRCTALTHTGKFCDYESLPDAPFPICVKHAALLLRFLNGVMPTSVEDRIILAARDFDLHREVPRKSATADREVVYYLRIGEHIKIGYTADLRGRMNNYPPTSELLAVEPGGYALEQQRHRQFTHLLRVAREWFEPGEDLMTHVQDVRGQYDMRQFLPPKRSPTPVVDRYGRQRTA